MSKLRKSEELLTKAHDVDLLNKLIVQLNKDFGLAGIDQMFELNSKPKGLINQLNKVIYGLLQNQFDNYLNLLYRVDISEIEIKKLDGSNPFKLSEQVTFLLLKREWQKVWFRNKL